VSLFIGTGRCIAPTSAKFVARLEAISERNRASLAQQLHDDFGGLLVSALMDLTWSEQHPFETAVNNQHKLTRARQSLTSAVDLERQLIEGLRPTLLDNVGLFATLRWHMLATCKLAHVECEINLPRKEPEFLPHAPIQLFRIVEEALTQLLLDESVTSARLKVTTRSRVLIVRVISNGTSSAEAGDDSSSAFSALRLQHRVATLGGDVGFIGPSAGGTSIVTKVAFENAIQ
jgi:signal transduction histidine kinase